MRPTYELKVLHESFGSVPLAIATLADLDRAVDELCARSAKGDGDELERDLCPYFGVIWPAARALALEIAALGPALAGVRVLEVGCGLALPSLVAAKLGARVVATDMHPDVPAFLERNLALNGLVLDALEYRELDWRAAHTGERFELVIGSDILYQADHAAPVARALAELCAPGGRILLTDPGRAYLQDCLDALARLGFRAENEVVRVADPSLDRAGDRNTREVFVLTLAR